MNERYCQEDELSTMMVPVGEYDPSNITRRFEDIAYGPLPQQKMDIYLPETGEGPFPLLMYIHGGGWMIGNKRLCFIDSVIDALDYGYAVASLDYRLLPEGRYPSFLHDIKAALRWIGRYGLEHGVDPERIALAGDSAGGTIALMAAFTEGRPEFEGGDGEACSGKIRAVCAMYAPSVLDADEAVWFKEAGGLCRRAFKPSGEEESPLYENAFGTSDAEELKKLSPISLVHADIPGVMLQHGMMDSVVPHQHSLMLAGRINEVCGEDRAKLCLYPERDHGDRLFLGKENCREIVDFLAKHMQ